MNSINYIKTLTCTLADNKVSFLSYPISQELLTEEQRRQNEFNNYLEESGQTTNDINVDVPVYGTIGAILFGFDGKEGKEEILYVYVQFPMYY